MNPLNLATLEASQRLVKAGIVLETDNYHVIFYKKGGEKDGIVHTEFVAQYEGVADIVPAPSMAEVWRLLPLDLMICRETHPDVDSLVNEVIKEEGRK